MTHQLCVYCYLSYPRQNLQITESSVVSRWWKDRNTIMALVGAAIMALLYNFEAELGPIFVSAPRKEVKHLDLPAFHIS